MRGAPFGARLQIEALVRAGDFLLQRGERFALAEGAEAAEDLAHEREILPGRLPAVLQGGIGREDHIELHTAVGDGRAQILRETHDRIARRGRRAHLRGEAELRRRVRQLQIGIGNFVKAHVRKLAAETAEIFAHVRAVGVDPAAGGVGIGAAGGSFERHGSIAVGHEGIDAAADHRDKAQIVILRLEIADGRGEIALAVDLERLREGDARLPCKLAGGRLHLQHERIALGGGHLLGGGRERLRRDGVRRQILSAQRLEILPRRGDQRGIVRLLIDELGRIDRGRRRRRILGRDTLAEHGEEHMHALFVIDDVFVEGVDQQQREEDQNPDHRERRAPKASPPAPPGTVNIGVVRCHILITSNPVESEELGVRS